MYDRPETAFGIFKAAASLGLSGKPPITNQTFQNYIENRRLQCMQLHARVSPGLPPLFVARWQVAARQLEQTGSILGWTLRCSKWLCQMSGWVTMGFQHVSKKSGGLTSENRLGLTYSYDWKGILERTCLVHMVFLCRFFVGVRIILAESQGST